MGATLSIETLLRLANDNDKNQVAKEFRKAEGEGVAIILYFNKRFLICNLSVCIIYFTYPDEWEIPKQECQDGEFTF